MIQLSSKLRANNTMKRITNNLFALSLLILLASAIVSPAYVRASGTNTSNTLTSGQDANADPTKSTFKIVVCDGPDISGLSSATQNAILKEAGKSSMSQYVACDFNGAMKQVQHLINILLVLGVFAAIVLFTYAGYLLMNGKEKDREAAKAIFPKIFFGFIIMLSAWFIVYQVLSWLTGSGSVFTKLLGQ
jgi:Type IV secretion system pilin